MTQYSFFEETKSAEMTQYAFFIEGILLDIYRLKTDKKADERAQWLADKFQATVTYYKAKEQECVLCL